MRDTFLMCSPEGFAVKYEINPWMKDQIGLVSPATAQAQWWSLHDKLAALADIRLIPGDAAWPDLVFTANAGLPLPGERRIVLSNFRYPQRQGEKPINRAWFEAAGWECLELPEGISFEGAGDALFDARGTLWLGSGPRSHPETARYVADFVAAPICSLVMVTPDFYHLDTCFCPLPGDCALYVPGAFDPASRERLAAAFGTGLIALTPEEGRLFCANAVCVGHTVIMNQSTPRLSGILISLGFGIVETPLTEFMKSGGSAKCLTLNLGGTGG